MHTAMDPAYDKWQNVLCAVTHLGSAIAILIAALLDSDGRLSVYNRPITHRSDVWLYKCWDAELAAWDEDDTTCAMPLRRYWLDESIQSTVKVPVLVFTVLFASWSGMAHAYLVWSDDIVKKRQVDARFYDYVVSASLMIVVIAAVFGASTWYGVLVAPLLQALVIWLGWQGELNRQHQLKYFGLAAAVYIAAWVPVFRAANDAVSTEGKLANEGTAPAFIVTILIGMFAIFSVFPVIYVIEWVYWKNNVPRNKVRQERNDRHFERVYNVTSCIAKLLLHSWLAIALFGMKERIVFAEADLIAPAPAPPDTESEAPPEAQAGMWAGIVVVFVGLSNFALYRYCRLPTKGPQGAFELMLG